MSYANYDGRFQQRPRHDSHYSRHEQPAVAPRQTPAAMSDSYTPRSSYNKYDYDHYSYDVDVDGYPPRTPPLPRRSAAHPQHRPRANKQTWPPSPSVEDETTSLTKEVLSSAVRSSLNDGEPPDNTRGAVDQEKVIEDIEPSADHRFILVSEPSTGHGATNVSNTIRDRRRKSVAERGNLAPIRTHVEDPPVFTERVSTPYAYTKPQKESFISSAGPTLLSPEPLAPVSKSVPPLAKNDVFADSDTEPDDITHLRTAERRPARYSFVKSDLQKEDLRTNTYNSQRKSETDRLGSNYPPRPMRREEASKQHSPVQSSASSSSSLSSSTRASKPAAMETAFYGSSRPPSRPASPSHRANSPKLPSRLAKSSPDSRPSSRGNTRPASPLSVSMPLRPPSPSRMPLTDADRYATYPPLTATNRSRPPSRIGRHETFLAPTPRIDVQSPSPARQPAPPGALPYPVDDRPMEVFMPLEEHYQFDHSSVPSPRQTFPESPRLSSTPIPASPRLRDDAIRSTQTKVTTLDEPLRTRRTRTNSIRSKPNVDGRREQTASTKLDVEKPLPSCPRSTPTSKYDDWYSLKGYRYFDICPGCYQGVFASTPFALHFSQTRLGERPIERVCDFSSPWIRLAWLLTIKQRLPSLEMIYTLADIAEVDRPCPDDRELSSDRVTWYGIPDQRDGVHVANFSICSADKRMIEALFPTMRGHFTPLPATYSSSTPEKYICSLRTSSRRFPRYLDLLVELDVEAQDLGQRPNINRFVQLARDHSFKGECAKGKSYMHKPWHFIPSLPEFTICEECYEELVWPAMQSRSTPSTIPRLFKKAIQLVPDEDPDAGSSCCLYSPRMRKVWDISVREEDFAYLKRKAIERRRAEVGVAKERKSIVNWMMGLDRAGSQWERAKSELKALEKERAVWE